MEETPGETAGVPAPAQRTCAYCTRSERLVRCVACGRPICGVHRGDEGGSYWSHAGKKGFACTACIQGSLAFEGGTLAIAREIKAHLHAVLLPRMQSDVRALVHEALDRVELKASGLTEKTLRELEVAAERISREVFGNAESTLERLVGRIEEALARQRLGLAAETFTELERSIDRALRRSLVTAVLVAGLVGAGLILLAHFLG